MRHVRTFHSPWRNAAHGKLMRHDFRSWHPEAAVFFALKAGQRRGTMR